MNTHSILRLPLLLSFFLVPLTFCFAQDGNPRHPGVARFELIANNTATDIVPLSDLNADGIADFALIDNSADPWIYFGVRGGLPESTSGLRLGPTDAATSATRIRAVGDWDGMNGPDICAEIELANDTSFGNTDGQKQIFRVVIFWNNGKGGFSLADTTHLSPGVNASYSALLGVSGDIDGDGIDDLGLFGGSSVSNGERIKLPKLKIFKGHAGQRWGRGAIPNTPDWQWWGSVLPFNFDPPRLGTEDLDQDNAIDLILYSDDVGSRPLSVFYGRHDGTLPDTLEDLQQVNMEIVGGKATNFADVSGDGIADLTVLNPSQSLVYIYIGCKGQRLREQFGTGNEPPQGERWWGKPWAAVKGPSHVNSVWFGLEAALFDFGSGDSNSTEEIWVVSSFYLLCYDVGGQVIEGVRYGLDSLFDGQVTPWTGDGKRLGDIDADGRAEFALIDNGVHIYRVVSQLPTPTGSWWRVPSCDTTLSVSSPPSAVGSPLSLRALPNPASGHVRILWQKEYATGLSATLRVSDILGQEVVTMTIPADQEEAVWNAATTFGGTYFVTISVDNASQTIGVVLR